MTKRCYRQIQVIFKVAERCNLNCSYCYYFNGGDKTYEQKPAIVSIDTVREIAKFLSDGIEALNIEVIWVSFHGGEPFMVKPGLLQQICGILKEVVGTKCRLELNAQTNGTHFNAALSSWIVNYGIKVSVSIDGMREENDRERKDHLGRGSFEKIRRNYVEMSKVSISAGLPSIPVLMVLDARNNYKKIMRGLFHDLNVRSFNFLLPDCSYDDGIPGGFSARDYGRVLCEIFESWLELGCVYVREIDLILRRFQLATKAAVDDIELNGRALPRKQNQIIVIRSDGELQIDDSFMPAANWHGTLVKENVREITLEKYLDHVVFDEIDGIYENLPGACEGCVWKNICHGGHIENRYSKNNNFDNPSIYCDGLRAFYRKVAKFLRQNGYPAAVMRDRLTPPDGIGKYHYAL